MSKARRFWVWALAGLFWASASQSAALAEAEFLSLAAGERGHVSPTALKKALAGGANVNFVGPRGLTPLMAFVSAHRETDREALAGLNVILAAGPDLEARSEEGGTALGYAILNRAGPRVIAALLAAGAKARTPLGPQGDLTPLFLAAGLEPDPLVSALLWAHGAGHGLPGSELLEQAKHQPEVLRILKGALEADDEEDMPLFTTAPPDQNLRARIKELETRLRPPRYAEDIDYLQWQIDLPLNVAARRELFGRTEPEAWLDEYAFRLNAAGPGPPPKPSPRDRVIFPGPRPDETVQEALAAAGRRVAILVYPSGLMVAHETASGRELWRRRPDGPTQLLPVGRLLLAATAWSGGLGEAVVLEPLTGAALLTLIDLDDPKWTVDAGRRALIISTDLTLDIFDLSAWKNHRWSWQTLLENQSWDEARRSARAMQNQVLAEYGENLDEEGRFTRPGSGSLFQPAPVPGRLMMDRARASLKARGYGGDLSPIAVEKIPPPVFVLGPACPAACGPDEADTPLILVNPVSNRLDALTVTEPAGGRPLTRGRLAESEGLKFSPGGTFLAATEDTGGIRFFAARDKGRYLGALPPQTRLTRDENAHILLRDLRLQAILTDDQSPLLLFNDPAEDRALLAEADLAGTALIPRPLEPGNAAGLAAFAATPAGQWAAGLTDGGLWLLRPGQPAPVHLAAEGPFSALAFSGDGRTLAAATGPNIRLFKGGRPEPLELTLTGEVAGLALDQGGRWLWAALTAPAAGGSERFALALVDLSGQGPPLYQPTLGRVLALNYGQGRVVALVEAPPNQLEPKTLEPTARFSWARGRAEILIFDQQRLAGQTAMNLPDRLFAGLSSREIFHQEINRPFAALGRLSLDDHRPGRLTSAGRGRRLGPASFDLSGRLAVFPELDGGSFYVYNLASGREITRGRDGDPEGLLGATFLKDPSLLLTFGRGGLIRLWSLKGAEPRLLLTWTFTLDGRWAVVDPRGLFDSNDPGGLDHILWSVGRGPARPLNSLDNFRPGQANLSGTK